MQPHNKITKQQRIQNKKQKRAYYKIIKYQKIQNEKQEWLQKQA